MNKKRVITIMIFYDWNMRGFSSKSELCNQVQSSDVFYHPKRQNDDDYSNRLSSKVTFVYIL